MHFGNKTKSSGINIDKTIILYYSHMLTKRAPPDMNPKSHSAIAQGVEWDNIHMTFGIVVFQVVIYQFAEWLQRTADGIVQMVLTHEDPKALHTPLHAGLDLHRYHHTTTRKHIIHLGLTVPGGILPVIQLRLCKAVMVFEQFQTSKHL